MPEAVDHVVPNGLYRNYCIPAVAIVDHATFFGVITLVGSGVFAFSEFFLLVLLGLLSCILRLREPSDKLAKALREPVLFLHAIQFGLHYYVNRSEYSGAATPSVLIEGTLCAAVLVCDLFIILYAYQSVSTLGDGKPQEQRPEINRFTCSTEADLASCTFGRSCAICLDDMRTAETFAKLECGHVFHAACLCKWLDSHERIPWCPYRCSSCVSEA
mmetsp:Transcript_35599/g.81583  ORF Transcript_35599/g.81583 Transcript_35599/m.81583 type:complete len:216 (+) Transcript_35599:83-730(+)